MLTALSILPEYIGYDRLQLALPLILHGIYSPIIGTRVYW